MRHARRAGLSSDISFPSTTSIASCCYQGIARRKCVTWEVRSEFPRLLFGKSPEEKLAIIREEASRAPTLFVGDGINDAPAMQAATVGIAFGQNSDITAEAADAVVMEPSLQKWMSSFTSAAECDESPSRAQLAEWR